MTDSGEIRRVFCGTTFNYDSPAALGFVVHGTIVSNLPGATFSGTWGEIEINAENLKRYSPEYLSEYQKALTGEGIDPMIEERREAYVSIFKNQMDRVLAEYKKREKSLKTKADDDFTWVDEALMPNDEELSLIAKADTYEVGPRQSQWTSLSLVSVLVRRKVVIRRRKKRATTHR